MPSRDIKDCVQELQDKWPLLREKFLSAFKDVDLELTCTHRSPDEQFELFKKGRRLSGDTWLVDDPKSVVTQIDGKHLLSNHNYYPARAFDLAIKDADGKFNWDLNSEMWKAIPSLVESVDLVSGGAWIHWKDFPHVEIKKDGWV